MDEDKTLDLKKIKVQCNLCNRWMPFEMYELHYEKCMDIQYLVNIAKQKGEKFTREDLENCRSEIIERLLKKDIIEINGDKIKIKPDKLFLANVAFREFV